MVSIICPSCFTAGDRPRDDEVERSEDDDDDEEQPGDRRGPPEVALVPAQVVDVHRERAPLAVGSTRAVLVVQSWLVEDLQTADRRGDDDEDDGRAQLRDGD
jgi:hypothetical protein